MKRIPVISAVYRDRNAIYEIARKDVKTQYRGSVLGFLWTILHPLLNMLVLWIIFRNLFGKSDPYYVLYLLCGNILFAAFRASTDQSLRSIVSNRGLLLRTKISPYIFPAAKTVTGMINFAYSLLALLPFMIYLSVTQGVNLFSYQLAFVLLVLPAFWLFELGMGLFLSALYVFFRDLRHIYAVILTLWMYLTPIFYKVENLNLDDFGRTVINCNPMYHFVTYFRECVYMGATAKNAEGLLAPTLPSWTTLGICYLCGVGGLILGIAFFMALKRKIIIRI